MTLEMRDRVNFYKGKQEGREEGKEEGRALEIIEMSLDYGVNEDKILETLQRKLKISQDAAQTYVDAYGKRVG